MLSQYFSDPFPIVYPIGIPCQLGDLKRTSFETFGFLTFFLSGENTKPILTTIAAATTATATVTSAEGAT